MFQNLVEIQLDIPKAVKEVEAALQIAMLKELSRNSAMRIETGEIEKNVCYDSLSSYEKNKFRKITLKEYLTFFESTSPLYAVLENSSVNENFFKSYIIAGGFPCDLYLEKYKNYSFKNRPNSSLFKDVDIFISADYDSEVLVKYLPDAEIIEEIHAGGYSDLGIDKLVRIRYKGITFELISTSLSRVQFFDYRFRNFFYKQNKTVATKNALKDIENKTIVLQTPDTSIASLVRAVYFQKKYNFKLNPLSKEFLRWVLANEKRNFEEIQEKIEKRTEDEKEKEWFRNEIKKIVGVEEDYYNETFKEKTPIISLDKVTFPFQTDLEDLFQNASPFYISEETYQLILDYQSNKWAKKKFSYPNDDVSELKRLIIENHETIVQDVYSNLIIETVTNPKTIDYFELKKFIDRRLEEKLNMIEDTKNPEIRSFYQWISNTQFKHFGDSFHFKIFHELKNLTRTLRISVADFDRLTSALKGNILTVYLENDFGLELARYTFRKVQRGAFVLSDTFTPYSEYYDEHHIHRLITILKTKTNGYFDFGIEGEEATRLPEENEVSDSYFILRDGKYVFTNPEKEVEIIYKKALTV